MATAIWSGAITFGLVHVPVRLFPATRSKIVRFHHLDPDTHARIRHQRVSSATGKEVPYERLLKGYEVGRDRYVVVTAQELDALDPVRSRSIKVEDFVPLASIDPMHYEQAYYLAPEPGGVRAYALLQRAMQEADKVAIARVVLRSREYLVALRPVHGALSLTTMRFPDELVPTTELPDLPDPAEVPARELAIARQLIDTLSTEFDPMKYRDEYRERLLELIKAKAEGLPPHLPPAVIEPPGVRNLLAALRASVAAARAEKNSPPGSANA